MENITDSDCNHPKRICKDFEITNLDLYQDLHLTLFKIGLFGAGHGCWRGKSGGKKAPLFKICHTCPKNETWHSYILPKKDSKIYINHVTYSLRSADISTF